ncbi:hypothetical protein GN956_G6171 [Arapaima gigas]
MHPGIALAAIQRRYGFPLPPNSEAAGGSVSLFRFGGTTATESAVHPSDELTEGGGEVHRNSRDSRAASSNSFLRLGDERFGPASDALPVYSWKRPGPDPGERWERAPWGQGTPAPTVPKQSVSLLKREDLYI